MLFHDPIFGGQRSSTAGDSGCGGGKSVIEYIEWRERAARERDEREGEGNNVGWWIRSSLHSHQGLWLSQPEYHSPTWRKTLWACIRGERRWILILPLTRRVSRIVCDRNLWAEIILFPSRVHFSRRASYYARYVNTLRTFLHLREI